MPIYEEETKENLSRELNIVSAFESCSGLIGNANATGGADKGGVSNRATTHFGTTYNGEEEEEEEEISVFMNPLSPHAPFLPFLPFFCLLQQMGAISPGVQPLPLGSADELVKRPRVRLLRGALTGLIAGHLSRRLPPPPPPPSSASHTRER